MDAAGLWKAVDGSEAQQELTRPPLPTSPCKTGTRPPVSHSVHRPRRLNRFTSQQLDRLNGRVERSYRRFAPTA